jgi:hypothetical protein
MKTFRRGAVFLDTPASGLYEPGDDLGAVPAGPAQS